MKVIAFCFFGLTAIWNVFAADSHNFKVSPIESSNRNDIADQTSATLESFSNPIELWGPGVEAAIEEVYRQCFKTYIINGKVITLRMPFAENNERSELAESALEVRGGGKSSPSQLWDEIDKLITSNDFITYTKTLADGREKVIIFDMQSCSWTTSRDLFELALMKAGVYQGLPHRPSVLVPGDDVSSVDIYNYLYCVGRLGLDCSGFVWHVLFSIAKKGGFSLEKELRQSLKLPSYVSSSLFVGTWFFDSRNAQIVQVKDQIRNLRPADIFLFRASDGTAAHSAIIQSIDRDRGVIRYLQSTDEAPAEDRGVHESFIIFDPAHPEVSLKDPSLTWTQKRLAPFAGESPSEFLDDGERFRAFPELGGGKVVRLAAMAKPIARISSAY